jgi:hypothetical protein
MSATFQARIRPARGRGMGPAAKTASGPPSRCCRRPRRGFAYAFIMPMGWSQPGPASGISAGSLAAASKPLMATNASSISSGLRHPPRM